MDVTIGDESPDDSTVNHRKERPIWMMESTVLNSDGSQVYSPSFHIFFVDFLYLLYNFLCLLFNL